MSLAGTHHPPSRPCARVDRAPLHVVVVGGGVAGVEALLALRALAGERVALTLVSARGELILPAMSVAEPFALGHAEHVPLAVIAERVQAALEIGRLTRVEDQVRQIVLEDSRRIAYDALLITIGGRPVPRVAGAATWWPEGDPGILGGLLRDLEEGYTKRVAFVIPPGASWPLPLYELALMTAREVTGMGIRDAELTIVTPEAVPLAVFGRPAAQALQDELRRAGIRLRTGSLVRLDPDHEPHLVLQPSGRRLDVERVIALPGIDGPRIPGTRQNEGGFIRVDGSGRMRDSRSVWAAGDAVSYPVKHGGLATAQADAAAADIAARAGAVDADAPARRGLAATLMTGADPVVLAAPGPRLRATPGAAGRAWKISGEYLGPLLDELAGAGALS